MIAPVRLAPNSPLNSPLKIKEAALPRLGFPSGPSLVAIGGRYRPERLFTIELTKSQGKSALVWYSESNRLLQLCRQLLTLVRCERSDVSYLALQAANVCA